MMLDLGQPEGVDIELPQPVELPQFPIRPETLPPPEPPIPQGDPAPPLVEARS